MAPGGTWSINKLTPFFRVLGKLGDWIPFLPLGTLIFSSFVLGDPLARDSRIVPCLMALTSFPSVYPVPEVYSFIPDLHGQLISVTYPRRTAEHFSHRATWPESIDPGNFFFRHLWKIGTQGAHNLFHQWLTDRSMDLFSYLLLMVDNGVLLKS